MASSSSRKLNSSASNQKPTFRRSAGNSHHNQVKRSSAPASPAIKPKSARTYVASSQRAAAKRASVARVARTQAAQTKKLARTASKQIVRSASNQTPTKRVAAAPARRSAAGGRVHQAHSSARMPASSARPTKAAVSKRPIAPVRAKAPTDRKLSLPFTAKGGKAAGKDKLSATLGRPAPVQPATGRPKDSSTVTSIPRIVAAIALAIVLVVGLGAAVMVNSGFFAVTEVVVNGSEHVPQQTVEQLIDVPEGATLLNVNDDKIASSLLANPWVSGVDIEREFPHTIVITPIERTVEAIVYISADDVAWAVSDDSHWIAPVSLATSQQPAAGSGSGEDTDATGGQTSAEGTDDAGASDQTAGQATSDAGSSSQASLDAAVALARAEGAVVLTDVGTDVSPSSGQEVTDERVLAGLAYASGFSDDFLAQIKEISIPSVEAISADLESGVEVSLGKPEDIQQKEQVIRTLLEQQQGVTYINVRVADAYSFRSAQVG